MPSTDREPRCVRDATALFRAAVRRVQADRLLTPLAADDWARRAPEAYDRVRVVGMGKAAMAMAGQLEAQGAGWEAEGLVIVPEGYPESFPDRLPPPERIAVETGGHPLPSADGVRAARRLRAQAEAATDGELLLVLVSGGGTALATLPAEGLDRADLRTTYHRLLTAGVPISSMNAVRKHLTALGGGQLARIAAPADVAGLVVSDVVGNDLATVASGPTVPDPTTYADAVRALYRADLWHDIPEAVRTHLTEGADGRHPDTPTAEADCFDTAQTTLIGTNEIALAAARTAAEDRGYEVRSVTPGVTGEARSVGTRHGHRLRDADVDRPTCWLWGGEPTVTVTGDGTGGRNQEVALSAAQVLDGDPRDVVFLSGGTDGIDGPTDAAGAWGTPATARQARKSGHDPETHLDRNDSYPVFEALGQLLRPGPTHTNVMDVHVGLVRPDG